MDRRSLLIAAVSLIPFVRLSQAQGVSTPQLMRDNPAFSWQKFACMRRYVALSDPETVFGMWYHLDDKHAVGFDLEQNAEGQFIMPVEAVGRAVTLCRANRPVQTTVNGVVTRRDHV